MFDVTDFGAVGDGTTDDLPAFERAIAALSLATIPGPTGGVIYVPRGTYRFAGNLHVTRPVILEGVSTRVDNTATTLQFDARCGVVVDYFSTAPDTGQGDGTIIRNLGIRGTMIVPDLWAADTEYEVGDEVRAADNNRQVFECIAVRGGATSGSGPDGPFAPRYDVDTSAPWQANREYRFGDVVRATDIFGMPDRLFVCSVPAYHAAPVESGSSEPTWNTTLQGETNDNGITWVAVASNDYLVLDNDVIWASRVYAGILLRAPATVDNCFITLFPNAGISGYGAGVVAGAPQSTVNLCFLQNTRILFCGLGVLLAGHDASAGVGLGLDVNKAGYHWSGTGGIGIDDHSALGNTWLACHVISSTGPAYLGDSAFGPRFFGCYAEADCGAIRLAGTAVWISGTPGCGFTEDSGGLRLLDADNISPIRMRNYQSTPVVEMTLGYQTIPVVQSWSVLNTDATRVSWQWNGADRWAHRIYNSPYFEGCNITTALPRPGFFAYPEGFLVGVGASERRIHFTDSVPEPGDGTAILLPLMQPGDHFLSSAVTAFASPGWVSTTTGGYPASNNSTVEWTASMGYEIGDLTEPTTPNGFIYQAIVGGTTSSSEPTWPTTIGDETALDGATIIWKCVGTNAPTFQELAPLTQVSTLGTGGAGPDLLTSGEIATDTVVEVAAKIQAIRSDETEGASFFLVGTFRNDSGTVSQIGATTIVHAMKDDPTWTATLSSTGTTWRVQVQGAAATDIRWRARVTVETVSY